MSLVPTYVLDSEGNWWKEPILSGTFASRNRTFDWFINFDDDDPIELVITDVPTGIDSADWVSTDGIWQVYEEVSAQLLEKMGIDYRTLSRNLACGRGFGEKYVVRFAFSFWIREMATPIPAQYITEGKKIEDATQMGQGVYYDFDLC